MVKGGNNMKKLIVILLIIALCAGGCVGYYFLPKTFAKNISPEMVNQIQLFDGSCGKAFAITDKESIKTVISNLQSVSMKRDGCSIGYKGYTFRVDILGENGNKLTPTFIINSDSSIRRDPFFYKCDGGLCYDYLKELEGALVK